MERDAQEQIFRFILALDVLKDVRYSKLDQKKFETLIKRMMDEDGINGYDNDIIVETETFEPSVSPDDFK